MNSLFPQLNIYLDGTETPTTVETTSLDFWTYEELVERGRGKTSEHGMRLTIAYIHSEGRDPKNLDEVKAWARERQARVTLGPAADPTQSAATAEP